MKVTVIYSNAQIALGFPKTVTFEVTAMSLTAFNRSCGDGIKNAPSFNEEWNRQRGLPDANARKWLRNLYSDKFGICGGYLTMADVKNAVS